MDERPDLVSSASIEPDVLRTSAVVGANERSMLTKAVVVSVPREESGGANKTDNVVMATGMAANGNITPSWLLNKSLST